MLVTASVLVFVLPTVVPAAVPPLVSVTLPVTEPVVPEPVVLAPELVRLLADSGCGVEEDSEPHAATKQANRTTVIDSDALFIAPLPFRMDARPAAIAAGREKRWRRLYHATGVVSRWQC